MNNIITQNDFNRQQRQFETINYVINQFGYMINPSCTEPLIPIVKLDNIPEGDERLQNKSFSEVVKEMKKKTLTNKKRPMSPFETNINWRSGPNPIPTMFVKSKMPIRRSRTKSESKRRNKRSRTKSDPVVGISGRYNFIKNNSAPANLIRKSNKPRGLRGGKNSKKKKIRNRTKKTKK